MYLAGRFEYCIRQVVEVVADEISNRATKYTDLPEPIRSRLKNRTIEIIKILGVTVTTKDKRMRFFLRGGEQGDNEPSGRHKLIRPLAH
jgi:hypothetical protein